MTLPWSAGNSWRHFNKNAYPRMTSLTVRTESASKLRRRNHQKHGNKGNGNSGSPKIVDFEKLKGEIYRQWVGRRNAFDLGKPLEDLGVNLDCPLQKGQYRGKNKLSVPTHVITKHGPERGGKFAPSRSGGQRGGTMGIPLAMMASHGTDRDMVGANRRGRRGQGKLEQINERSSLTTDKTSLGTGQGTNVKFGLTPEQINAFREVFDLFDSNGGGTIDAMELDETLRSVDISLAPEEITEVLDKIDKDGSGEIDFEEFLQLMTSMERFLEVVAGQETRTPDPDQKKNVQREMLFFDALAQFMKKSALKSMDEIVGYYHTKARKFQAPHVVGHYAAGARLIGLTEKQLYEHLETLKANAGQGKAAHSPYAQPLHFYTSTTKVGSNKLIVKKMVKKASGLSVTKRNGGSKKRGRIVLKVNVREKQGKAESDRLPKVGGGYSSYDNKLNAYPGTNGHMPYREIKGGGWVSQRTDHVEIKLPPVFLKQIGAFHSLTAEDLPEVRIHVDEAIAEYTYRRRAFQIARNLAHWNTLNAELISPEILRNHFQQVFSHYSYVPMKHLQFKDEADYPEVMHSPQQEEVT